MSDYTAEALRARAANWREMAEHAQAAETKHRIAAAQAPSMLARYAAQALMQTSGCTARHWKKLADNLEIAAENLEEKEAEVTRMLHPTRIA